MDLPTALREYGRRLEAEGAVDDPNTLPRLLDKFVIEHAAKKKPKTLEMYDRCVGLLKPVVADFGPHQLTASDVTQIVRAVGKKHGAITADQCRATLSAGFGFAIELGLATTNPVRDMKKIAIPKRKRAIARACAVISRGTRYSSRSTSPGWIGRIRFVARDQERRPFRARASRSRMSPSDGIST
jgi:hypothetical protein